MRTVAGIIFVALLFFFGCIHLDVAWDKVKSGRAWWFDFGVGIAWILITVPILIRAGQGLMCWIFNLS